jgi:hypothetical protein
MSLPPKELHTYVEAQIQETSSSVNFFAIAKRKEENQCVFSSKKCH